MISSKNKYICSSFLKFVKGNELKVKGKSMEMALVIAAESQHQDRRYCPRYLRRLDLTPRSP